MRVLFVPMVGGRGIGPICRCTAVANEIRDCDILFLAERKFASFIEKSGYKYVEDVGTTPIGNQGSVFLWNDAAYIMGLCRSSFVRRAFEHQKKIVEEYKPDVIFTEYNLTILIVAKVLNIPIVSTVNWADYDEFSLAGEKHEMLFPDAVREYNNIICKYSTDVYKSIGDLATAIPVLVAPTTDEQQPELRSKKVCFVGELLNRSLEIDANSESSIATNNIYVYLSTSDLPRDIWLTTILRIAKQMDNTFYIVTKEENNIAREKKDVPPNVIIREWLPSLSILLKSNLVIHAGSANIISGALLCGVPSLMIPLEDGERLYNSRAIQRLGCGRILERSAFCDVDHCLMVIRSMLSESSYSYHCQRLGNNIRNLGGTKRIARIIREMAEKVQN